MAKVGMIGAGSWGTALTWLLSNNGHRVTVWSALEAEIEMLRETREQKEKLPGVVLSEDTVFTTDLAQAVRGMDLLVLAVPSPFTRATAHRLAPLVAPGQILVNVAKGIEEKTLLTLSQVIEEEVPQAEVAVLSGPSHAEEVGRGMPTAITAGARRKRTAEYIQTVFMSDVFRVYASPDVLGIELGAALKNVVALAAGIADGIGCGDNTKAALITRALKEICMLGVKMGGHMETFFGLSGIGDLIVTCASVHSRNRRAGYLIGQGYSMEEAMREVKMVVEGVYSARAAMALAASFLICAAQPELPLFAVLFEAVSALHTVGMSAGITRELGTLARLVLILLMYAGRLGSLTFALLLARRPAPAPLRLPADRILIG